MLNYYNNNKNLLFLTILCFIFAGIFGFNFKFLNNLKTDLKNSKKLPRNILKGGAEGMGMGMGMGLFDRYRYDPFYRFVLGIPIYERLSEVYDWQDWRITGKILKWITYIFPIIYSKTL